MCTNTPWKQRLVDPARNWRKNGPAMQIAPTPHAPSETRNFREASATRFQTSMPEVRGSDRDSRESRNSFLKIMQTWDGAGTIVRGDRGDSLRYGFVMCPKIRAGRPIGNQILSQPLHLRRRFLDLLGIFMALARKKVPVLLEQ